jgi:hypothetical protein
MQLYEFCVRNLPIPVVLRQSRHVLAEFDAKVDNLVLYRRFRAKFASFASKLNKNVIPAQAGISEEYLLEIPAFAGMTRSGGDDTVRHCEERSDVAIQFFLLLGNVVIRLDKHL